MKIVAIILLLASALFAQGIEYGKTSDLKGLTKVFVDTGSDMETRNRIIENLEKAKLGIELLDSIDDAEIVMLFAGEKSDTIFGVNTIYGESSATTTVTKVPLIAGAGRVFVAGKDGKRPRLILSVENSQQSRLEKRPSTKFANAFIKAYKEANGLK